MTQERPTTIGVSIPIPAPYGEFLQARRADFGDEAAWRIPAHITLLPPTQVEAATYAAFLSHCARVAAAAAEFEVVLRGTGTFRPLSDVVFVKVERGVSACEGLEMSLRSGPVMRGLEFAYHPHVTVAHHGEQEALDRACVELASFSARFVVGGFHLYELGDDDVWRPMHAFDLASPATG